jgi:hypothetical protein
MFAQSAESLKEEKNEMISIKVTGLINMHTLKQINDAVILRDNFWKKNSVNGKLNSQNFFNGLQKLYSGIS